MTQKQSLEVRFVADEDVLDHIVEKQQGYRDYDLTSKSFCFLFV